MVYLIDYTEQKNIPTKSALSHFANELNKGVYLTVAEAAKKLGCSERRVRTLLSQSRLLGEYVDQERRWLVNFPFRIVHGKRGPKLGQKPSPAASQLVDVDTSSSSGKFRE